jgi:hypothetical protein
MADIYDETTDAPVEAPAETAAPAPFSDVATPEVEPVGESVAAGNAPFDEALAEPFTPSPVTELGTSKSAMTHAKMLGQETDARLERQRQDALAEKKAEQEMKTLRAARAEKAQWTTVHAMEGYVAERQQAAKDMMKDLQNQNIRYRQAIDDFKNFNPNPWANRGTGYLLGSALAAALGGVGTAMTGAQNNPALQLMNQALQEDIQVQRMRYEQAGQNVQNESTLYGQMREIYKDQESAMSATWAASKELLSERAKAIMGTLSPRERTLEAQQMVAQLDAESQEEYMKAGQKHFDNRIKAEQAQESERAHRAAESYRARILESKLQQSPNMFQAAGLKGQQLNDSNNLYTQYTGPFTETSRKVNQFFALPLSEQVKYENFVGFESHLKDLSQTLKQLKKQGVRFSEALQKIDEQLSTGTKGEGFSKVAMNVLTGGGGAAAFKEANGLMAKEFQKSILVSSGHPVSYWQAVERKKLEEDNRINRFNAGLGTEQDLGSE